MRPTVRFLAAPGVAFATLALSFVLAGAQGPPRAAGPFPPAQIKKAGEAKAAPAAGKAAIAVKVAPAIKKMAVLQPPGGARFQANQQYLAMLRQCRPMLRAEFHIVRAACRPTPEQLKAIARAGEAALRDVARSYADTVNRPMTVEQRMALDPRKLLQQSILKALPTVLPAEKAALYEKDLARRAEARRRNSVRAIVAHLDRDLLLDAKQRAEIERSFNDNWDERWGQSPQQFMNNTRFLYPVAPNRLAVPFLGAAQATIWHDLPKGQQFFGLAVFVNAQQDPLEDPELREARIEADKQEGNAQPGRNHSGEVAKQFNMMMQQMKKKMKTTEKARRKP